MTEKPKDGGRKRNRSQKQPEKIKVVGGGADSFAAKRMRQLAETAPVTGADIDISLLPRIPMPDIKSIEVHVPALPPVTEKDIMDRFERIYYDTCVERHLREIGEPVQIGDEILIDLIAYVGGKILPFNSHENLRIRLEPNSIHPDFGTALAGSPVGETKVLALPLPQGEGSPLMTERKIAFVVDLKKAASLTFPQADAPETLKQLEMGATLNDVYGAIAETLGNERASLMLTQGMALALDALADRVEVTIDPAHIDAEIHTQWSKTEGRFLMDKGLSRQDMDDALAGWLRDESTRKTALQRLKIAMVVMAYALQDPEELTTEEVAGFFEEYAEEQGIDIKEWRAALAKNPDEQAALLSQYLYFRTVTHLVAEVPIHYEN